MTQLAGKIAIVTAAGSGIGRAAASIMAARGASVLVTDILADSARRVADEITAAGGVAEALAVDVETPTEIKAMVAHAVSVFGGLDILHNNAALLDPAYGERDRSLLTLAPETWDRFMAVNLRSVMLGCQAAIPEMIKRGGGSIINTASTLGMSGDMFLTAYGTSKAAIIGLTKHVATAFGKQGIRCNAVAPSVIMTPTVKKFLPPELLQYNLDEALTPFLGQPDDVGHVVAFLASSDARFITGQVIAADGGTMAHLPTVSHYRRFFEAAAAAQS